MTLNDLINGSFELGGALLLTLNIVRILKERSIKGVHWLPTAFFTIWGCWNLFYYPSLGQWISFVGGMAVVIVNATWLILVYRFRKTSK